MQIGKAVAVGVQFDKIGTRSVGGIFMTPISGWSAVL